MPEPEHYGKKVGRAFRAIARLHSDLARLFREVGQTEFKEYVALHRAVTLDVSKKDSATCWMPYFAFRYFKRSAAPDIVEGVTCILWSSRFDEPMLVFSKLRYPPGAGMNRYDVWHYLEHNHEVLCRAMGTVVPVGGHEQAKSIDGHLLAVPTYSIESRGQVNEFIQAVREASATSLLAPPPATE